MRARDRQHLDEDDLRALARGSARGEAAVRHATTCRECRAEIEFLAAVAVASPTGLGSCPDPVELLRLTHGGKLDAGKAKRLEQHVAQCRECVTLIEAVGEADAAVSSVPIHGRPGAGSRLAELLAGLVHFEMPRSLAFATRGRGSGGAASAAGSAGEAMAAYREGRYEEARRQLERAARAGGGTGADLSFYLGACHLHARRPRQAERALAAAVKARPRLQAYRWLHAQSLLALGRLAPALAELEQTAKLPGVRRQAARQLAARVRELAGESPRRRRVSR